MCEMSHATKFDEVGGISADIVKVALPWIALTLASCFGIGLSLINQELVRTVPEQNVVSAVCCIAGAGMYLVYMIVNKLLGLFMRSINQEHSIRLRVIKSDAQSKSVGGVGMYCRSAADAEAAGAEAKEANGDEEVEYDAGVETVDSNNEDDVYDDEDSEEVSLYISPSETSRKEDIVVREEMISSMYMGGAGAFMAIPSLCMWDMAVTAIFILSLQVCALTERIKVLEYKPNVDRVTAINVLRALHWGQHAVAFFVLVLMFWRDHMIRVEPITWQLCTLAACAPPLLKIGCQHWPSNQAVGLSPTHTLETGLPVSTLLAILVLCWYSPVEVMLERHVVWSKALCLILMNPPALAVMIAFILRGFRRCHTLGMIVLLTTLAVIRRQWYTGQSTWSWEEITMVVMVVALVGIAASRAFYRMDTVASDELSYAEIYGRRSKRRQGKKQKPYNLQQHMSPYD